ncbi:MAG TPA: LuxR C-terminal-related transcriptional regulator [Anaerolineales bacterium]|nr:LuxR C-terminal-related transcriptional regulator [Anaerolineales bacterium]
MPSPILSTKLYVPPAGKKPVERSHLLDLLTAAQSERCRLVLVSAQAGSGKTTAIVQWIRHIGWPVGWVSLDRRDNQPKQFFVYLIAALRQVMPEIGKEALELLDLPGLNLEEIVLLLANELQVAPDPFVMVLDDFQSITNPVLHQVIDTLLDVQPPQIRLVLLSREDPPIQLARRRVSGELIELRQADLRFSLSESIEFLNQTMGLHLSITQVETLEARTEGWIAGLQMAALSMQYIADVDSFIRDFSGSHRFILDFLIEQVLTHRSQDIQKFLMETSILEQMSASLCAATTGTTVSYAQRCLDELDRANLFVVPLDEERHWYRYHHLFADLLVARLQAENPQRVYELYRCASDWHEQNGDHRMAVEYALKATDLQHAADLIERNINERWQFADQDFLLLAKRLPMEVIAKRPSLCLLSAWVDILTGRTERIIPLIEAAEHCLLAADRIPESTDAANLAFAKIMRAYVTDNQNLPVEASKQLEQAYIVIPEENVGMRNSVGVAIGSVLYMEGEFGTALRYFEDALQRDIRVNGRNAIPISVMRSTWVLQAQGRLKEAIELISKYAEYIRERGNRRYYIAGGLNLHWGEILLEWNQLDEAKAQIEEGLLMVEDWPNPSMISLGLCLLSRLKTVLGDLPGAEATLGRAEVLQRQSRFQPEFIYAFERAQVRLWIAQRNLTALESWVHESSPVAHSGICFRYEARLIELCRAWLALGRKEEAAALLDRLAEAAIGRNGRRIAILALLAAASKDEPDRAYTTLEEALNLAEPEGYLRVFLDAGEPFQQILKAWLRHRRSQGKSQLISYAQRLLKAFEEPLIMPTKPTRPTGLIEPLSKREMEVLTLIAKGCTNQQIAASLVISIRTVKKHIENIHGKLAVQNRIQAISRARELGLISV